MNPSPDSASSSIHHSPNALPFPLVVIRLRRIGQVENDRRMGLGPATVGERAREIDRAVEVERAVGIDVDVKSFEVSRRVDEPDVARLHKVVGDDNVFLVRSDFDVVGANGRLDFVRVVQALDVVEVGDVERRDVVGRRERDCQARK